MATKDDRQTRKNGITPDANREQLQAERRQLLYGVLHRQLSKQTADEKTKLMNELPPATEWKPTEIPPLTLCTGDDDED